MKVQNVFALDQSPDTFDDAAVQRDDLQLIDTSPVDPYRQGTEIRNQHQYLAGPYKVLSGERGHALTKQPIGQGAWRSPTTITWNDASRFDPVEFVTIPTMLAPPLSYGDGVPDVPQLYDGLLNPSIGAEVELRVFRGTMMDGNTADANGTSDQIITVNEFVTKNAGVTFVDSFDGDADAQRDISSSTVGPFFDADNTCYELFNREFWPAAAPTGIDIAIVDQLIRQMQRGDSYVQSWQRSATAGFQYASQLGTDSIAFGDMVHR